MDPGHSSHKRRHGLEPTQRRVRHIRCIFARNLTFTQNSNQRTLASVFQQQQPDLKYGTGASSQFPPNYHHALGSTHSGSNSYISTNVAHQSSHRGQSRSITPSLDLPSGASSPTRGYFRSPWNTYQYGMQRAKGPGSDTGSISASESGRGMSASIKEPIARLSAGIKASVLNKSNAFESGYTSDSGVASRSSSGQKRETATASPGSKKEFRYSRNSRTPEPGPSSSVSLENSMDISYGRKPTVDQTPPPRPIHDKLLFSNMDVHQRSMETLSKVVIQDYESTLAEDELPIRLPSFVCQKGNHPVLLDTYFTLHDPLNDSVIYTSDAVMRSNNPNYNPLEDYLFLDPTTRRSSSVTIRIWAGCKESDFYPLLEWRVDLCCLQFVGKGLRDIPVGLPNNTILIRFDDGFYTAPDEDDVTDHPHTSASGFGATLGSKAKKSYTYESATRLNNLHECIADTKKSRDEIKHNIDVALNKENAPLIMQKRKGEYTERLWHLQRQLGHELNVFEQAQEKAAALRQRLAERRQALLDSRERGQTQEMYLDENIVNLTKNKESLFSNLKEYSTKRTELIATLFTIFPITESENDPDLLTICKVPLPNSVYFGADEDMISIALGLTCHLVTMLAHYLCVPLRYPLIPMGSRASVFDPVSLLVGPKDFPLFGKGQDRLRFEYGVFLLNKDIEQLMNSQGLQFMDLRQTLPNIRYLMETLLTTSPVQSMLYRSKFLGRRKQDRLEQERLNDLFVISHEQHEFDSILHPTTGLGIDNDQDGRHQRGISSATSSSTGLGERTSHLVREYDPIDGEYTLILDSPSMRSPASRKTVTATTTPKDSPSSVRKESLSIPMSPARGSAVRTTSRLRRPGYVSSIATTDTEEEDGSQKSEDPSFSGWPGEPHLQEDEPAPKTTIGDTLEDPTDLFPKPFDSKMSRISRSLFEDSSQEGGSNSSDVGGGSGSNTRSLSLKAVLGSIGPSALSTPSRSPRTVSPGSTDTSEALSLAAIGSISPKAMSTPSGSPRTDSLGSVNLIEAVSLVPQDEDPHYTDPQMMLPSTPTQPEPSGLEEKEQEHEGLKLAFEEGIGPQSMDTVPTLYKN